MEVVLAVLADAASISEDNKLNMLGVFQTIRSGTAPFAFPQMVVVVLLRADPGENADTHNISISLADAERKEVTSPLELTIRAETVKAVAAPDFDMPIIIGMSNFMFPHFGDYVFQIEINDEHKKSINLAVSPSNIAHSGARGMNVAEKILDRMRRTKEGWKPQDFETLYTGFGFTATQGGNHTTYRYKEYGLYTQVARHNRLAAGYAVDAVKLIEAPLVKQANETQKTDEEETNE